MKSTSQQPPNRWSRDKNILLLCDEAVRKPRLHQAALVAFAQDVVAVVCHLHTQDIRTAQDMLKQFLGSYSVFYEVLLSAAEEEQSVHSHITSFVQSAQKALTIVQ